MYLFVQLLHIETGWVIKGVNSESGKIQTPESRSSKFKLNHARNFFKGVHQCQTDIVQEAGLFAPSLASFDETIETFWKCQLPCLSPVPVLCAINVFKRQFLLWFCKIRRLVLVFLPGSWMCLCWDWGHWRCASRRCTAHASVVYIEAWLSSIAGWWYCCGAGRRRCRGEFVLPAVGPLSPMMTRALLLTKRTPDVEVLGLPDEE